MRPMAKRRTIKEPETRGRVTVKAARGAAGTYRSASTGRFVGEHASKKRKK